MKYIVRFFIKSIFTIGLMLILGGLIFIRKDDIITILNTYLFSNQDVSLKEKNNYYREYDFTFVQNTDDFSPNNYQDILNIFYTVINSGNNTFTFYCPAEYESCTDDIKLLANDQDTLSDINNYVHPFNSFSHIETEYDTLGKVTINIIKSYKDEEITLINERIDALSKELISNNLTQEDNIRTIHDYIINHTKYDSDRSDNNIINYKSDIAYGPLFEGYALCGGYSDLMELFLEKMNIKSFKVSSEKHVWNAIQLGNNWYHLDLTWDDPVAMDGNDYLDYNYFLIDTNNLLNIEKTQHNFNMDHYKELL